MVYTLNIFNFNQVIYSSNHSQNLRCCFMFNTMVQLMDAESIKSSFLSLRLAVPAFDLGYSNLCHYNLLY